MKIEQFISNFKEQFDFFDEEPVINVDTDFKSLEDWDSLVALSVIAMADSEYGVSVSGDDIRNSTTLGDLISLIETKM